VPFCASRCAYCDFHSCVASASQHERWFDAIRLHLAALDGRHGEPGFRTIYIGGGTPSVLPRALIEKAMGLLVPRLAPAAGEGFAEATMEANPEDIDGELLSLLSGGGITRLSVGVQSLEDAARRRVERRGSAKSTRAGLELIQKLWKGRSSADFIYGLPGQSARGLQEDLAYAADLGFGHISLYELTIAEESPLGRRLKNGEERLPEPEEAYEHYAAARELLLSRGYRRYEISNWCLPSQESAHNLNYWRMGDWLALGPSASGNLRKEGGAFLRTDNSGDDEAYYADPSASADEYRIDGFAARFEYIMMALRSAEGLKREAYRSLFNEQPDGLFGDALASFPSLIVEDQAGYRPSERGMDTLNQVLLACLNAGDTKKASA
jgi:oxygen-independent coproporphyrinogen-3 oxidase